jgi:hypothetical protein
MATIVNGPGNDGDRGAGGWIIAIVVIIILILLALFLFPSLFGNSDGNNTTNDVNVTLPGNTTGTNPPGGTGGTGGTDGSGTGVVNTFNSTTTSTTTIE